MTERERKLPIGERSCGCMSTPSTNFSERKGDSRLGLTIGSCDANVMNNLLYGEQNYDESVRSH